MNRQDFFNGFSVGLILVKLIDLLILLSDVETTLEALQLGLFNYFMTSVGVAIVVVGLVSLGLGGDED